MAIFPELDSMMVLPGPIFPDLHASRIILNAGRSLALPPGLSSSILAYISSPVSADSLFSLIKGVLPIVDRIPPFRSISGLLLALR
ncbi:hypothetical protein D3C73_1218050 [compost metagenome]